MTNDTQSKTRRADEVSDATLPAQDPTPIRGWLLVFCILLAPHTIQAAFFLLRYWQVDFPPNVAPHTLEIVTTAVTLVGNILGYVLIFTRNRYAPAYFVLYLPLALLLLFADPHPIATYVARLQRFGVSDGAHEAADQARAVAVYLASTLGICITTGYWVKSERVRAVFGSNGLRALRRRRVGSGSVLKVVEEAKASRMRRKK